MQTDSEPDVVGRSDREGLWAMGRRSLGALVVFLVSALSLMVCVTLALGAGKRFQEGYLLPLTKAAEATDPGMVFEHVREAIRYAEEHGLAQGNTADPPTAREDLGAWHRALLTIEADSGKLDADSTLRMCRELRKRTRTALIDPSTQELRYPHGMALYPWQHAYLYWMYFSLSGVLFSLLSLLRRLLLE